MLLLTEDAKLVCLHEKGKLSIERTQDLVTVEGRALLVRPNPENRSISLCPNYGIGIKPCTRSLKVRQGYSTFLSIADVPICLDSVRGLTDGTPPGAVEYRVSEPGQAFVAELA